MIIHLLLKSVFDSLIKLHRKMSKTETKSEIPKYLTSEQNLYISESKCRKYAQILFTPLI